MDDRHPRLQDAGVVAPSAAQHLHCVQVVVIGDDHRFITTLDQRAVQRGGDNFAALVRAVVDERQDTARILRARSRSGSHERTASDETLDRTIRPELSKRALDEVLTDVVLAHQLANGWEACSPWHVRHELAKLISKALGGSSRSESFHRPGSSW